MNQIRYTNVCTCNNFYNDCMILALTVLFPLMAYMAEYVLTLVKLLKELTSSIRYVAYCNPHNRTSSPQRDHSSTKISSCHAAPALIYYRDKSPKFKREGRFIGA